MGDVAGSSTAPSFKINKAKENYARLCQLIVTICGDLFRDILSRYIKPADMRSELDKNRSKLKRLNTQQKEQVYPSSATTVITSKDFDISLMYTIFRNICNIPEHHNGWGNEPRVTDTSLAACIERIRIQRNLISGHSSIGEIDDTQFQDRWGKLKDAILEIEKQMTGGDVYERRVNDLLTCDLYPSGAEYYVQQFKRIEGSILH
jgi:hypothetical protein